MTINQDYYKKVKNPVDKKQAVLKTLAPYHISKLNCFKQVDSNFFLPDMN